MSFPTLALRLPGWVDGFIEKQESNFPRREDRMRLTIELARQNVRQGTGGPFGAAVFDLRGGGLVAPGINLVVSEACSVFHAEMVAIMLSQRVLRRYDLGDGGRSPCTLVTSTEPCAMCYGALPWAGINELVCGAREEDARKAGFDEGDKHPEWAEALEKRGIRVIRNVRREEAVEVLQHYAQNGGEIYNPEGK